MLSKEIAEYPTEAIKEFIHAVTAERIGAYTRPHIDLPEKKSKRWCVVMSAISQWMVYIKPSEDEYTKQIMANILIEVHEKTINETNDGSSTKPNFKKLARRIYLPGRSTKFEAHVITFTITIFFHCSKNKSTMEGIRIRLNEKKGR